MVEPQNFCDRRDFGGHLSSSLIIYDEFHKITGRVIKNNLVCREK